MAIRVGCAMAFANFAKASVSLEYSIFSIVFFISLIAATVWFVFKGVVYYRNKSRQDHYPNNNGVEMRQVEVIDEGEGII